MLLRWCACLLTLTLLLLAVTTTTCTAKSSSPTTTTTQPPASTSTDTSESSSGGSGGSSGTQPAKQLESVVADFAVDEKLYGVTVEHARGGDVVVSKDSTVVNVKSEESGVEYTCVVPLSAVSGAPSAKAVGSEDSLISPLAESCLLYDAGWWHYKVCHDVGVYQYHDSTTQYSLGVPSGSSLPTGSEIQTMDEFTYKLRSKKKSYKSKLKAYFSEHYSGGTVCDDVKPKIHRSSEVRYVCNPNIQTGIVSSIEEVKHCTYVIYVETALLCDHPRYSSTADLSLIKCFPDSHGVRA